MQETESIFKKPDKKHLSINRDQFLAAAKECEKGGRFRFHNRMAETLGITIKQEMYLQHRFEYKAKYETVLSPKRLAIVDAFIKHVETIGVRGALVAVAKQFGVSRQCVDQCVAIGYKQLGLERPKHIRPIGMFVCYTCGKETPNSDRKRWKRCPECEKKQIKMCPRCRTVMPLSSFISAPSKTICKKCASNGFNSWRKKVLEEGGKKADEFRARTNRTHHNWEQKKKVDTLK